MIAVRRAGPRSSITPIFMIFSPNCPSLWIRYYFRSPQLGWFLWYPCERLATALRFWLTEDSPIVVKVLCMCPAGSILKKVSHMGVWYERPGVYPILPDVCRTSQGSCSWSLTAHMRDQLESNKSSRVTGTSGTGNVAGFGPKERCNALELQNYDQMIVLSLCTRFN
mmetsp:Transcript_8337/g.16991  ORF Transcript_8337/g.16991 Transcript_8337/m.16991 type:complete len:167 (+) Transcript_8337:1800-2300(+)